MVFFRFRFEERPDRKGGNFDPRKKEERERRRTVKVEREGEEGEEERRKAQKEGERETCSRGAHPKRDQAQGSQRRAI